MAEQKLIDLAGLTVNNTELKKYVDELVRSTVNSTIVQKNSYLEFPTVGSENAIYIDKNDCVIYRWDNETMYYYKVAESIENLKIIDGSDGF